MKIQLLHFPDCPNAEAARTALREALLQEHVLADVEEIDTSREDSPAWAKGWGSPTILIDGHDVGGEQPMQGEARCRLYKHGAPTVADIRRSLRGAKSAGCGDLVRGTLLAIGFAAYPTVIDANDSTHTRARGTNELRLHVTGMDCGSCTKVLTKRLSRIPEVATVDVDYDRELAVVTYDGNRDISQALIDAVDDVGYQATVVRGPSGIRRITSRTNVASIELGYAAIPTSRR